MVKHALLLLVACKAKEVEPRPWDARGPIDAAVPIDAGPIDARAKDAPTPVKLTAGDDATCAVMSDATLRCWGKGPLATAPDLHAVRDLQLAGGTACALLDDGSVACWGRIAWHGKPEDTAKPAGILGVVGVKQMFVLPGLGCGRVADDTMVCWGAIDPSGHPAAGAHRQPTPAVGMARVKVLMAEAALRDDGSLFTWTGKATTRADVAEVGIRDGAICGRIEDGSVECAGGPCAPVAEPVVAPPPPPPDKKPAKKPAKPAKRPAKPAPVVATVPPPSRFATLGVPPAKQLAFELGWCVVSTANKLECSESCMTASHARLDKVERVAGRCVLLTGGALRCDGKPISGVQKPAALAGSCAIIASGIVCWGADGKAAPVEL